MKSFCLLFACFTLPSCTSSFIAKPSSAPKISLHATTVSPNTNSKLFTEYITSRGEILDPYTVLKVSSDATTQIVKQSYYKLSKIYHPDGKYYLFRDVLPGRCKNIEDVEYEWEKINTSKEILTNAKKRTKYDRLITMLNPQDALIRGTAKLLSNAVFDVIVPNCIALGSFACKSILKTTTAALDRLEEHFVTREMNQQNDFKVELSQATVDTIMKSVSAAQDAARMQVKEFTVYIENEWKNMNDNVFKQIPAFMKQF